MKTWLILAAGAVAILAAAPGALDRPSLKGSPASMERQHNRAVASAYTFAEKPEDVKELLTKGSIVPVTGSPAYELAMVSHPYARPEVRTFIERTSNEYYAACGEKLVVTSLTRPRSSQPGNAHKLSVHPAGMAVDFRISREPKCREFMEKKLLDLERDGLLDITKERSPAHYHVAVFPAEYRRYASKTPAPPVIAGPTVSPSAPSDPTAVAVAPAPNTAAAAPAQAAPAAVQAAPAEAPARIQASSRAERPRTDANALLALGGFAALIAAAWMIMHFRTKKNHI